MLDVMNCAKVHFTGHHRVKAMPGWEQIPILGGKKW